MCGFLCGSVVVSDTNTQGCRQQVEFSAQGADKSLARPRTKEARKHVRDASDFNNMETRAVIKYFFLQGKASKEIRAILTETLACFLPGRAKDLSAPLYCVVRRHCGWPSSSVSLCKTTLTQFLTFLRGYCLWVPGELHSIVTR